MTRLRAARDIAARERAVIDTSVNIVVSAGAGTGKTSLLVERILHAVGSGVAPLSEIAAITFTEKAAGELRHRLASGLDDLAALARGEGDSGDSPGARAWRRLALRGEAGTEVAERARAAVRALDRATVSTIHAFCADLLRAHPVEAGLPPGFRPERGAAAWRASESAWNAFLAEELGPGGRRAALWDRVLRSVSLAEAGAIARALLSGAVPDRSLAGEVAAVDLRAAMGDAATACADALGRAAATSGLTPAPREWMEAAERVLRSFASDGATAARRVIGISDRLDRTIPSVRTKDVSSEDAAALELLMKRASEWINRLARLDEVAMADVVSAVAPFVRRIREALLRAGLVDFDALLVRARDLLRDETAVRNAVKRRYRMLLLDEFQDTDPLQYEIVFFASEQPDEWADDAYATRLAPGRLFIVGDAKQSIYRFRGADFAAYRRAVEHVCGQGGVELSLTTNFRSTAAVLDPINALFASSSWKASDYLPPYEPIEAHRDEAASGPAVEIWSTARGAGGTARERRRLEGQALAREIASLAGPGTPTRYSDVLVLFRSFSEIGPYLRALRGRGVPFVVSGGRTFFERTEIVQAKAVLRAVADPADQSALLAYLRSPAGGVDDRELATHARMSGSDPWSSSTAVDHEACPSLASALAGLHRLRASIDGMPVDAAVRKVLSDSGLLPLSGLAFEAAQRVANLEKLSLAANVLARDGTLTLDETLDAIEDSLESEEEGDSPLADETVDAVRIMTIHKAKGLEARVVFLADASAGHGPPGGRPWKARTASFGAVSYVSLAGPSMVNGAAFAASIDDAAHEAAEKLRLLYVAMTRARDRLIVFGGGTRNSPWLEALAGWGYDWRSIPADGVTLGGGVLHRIASPAPSDERAEVGNDIGALDAVTRYTSAVAAVARLAAPEFRAPSAFDEDRARGGDGPRTGAPAELAREIGSIVHARLAGVPAAEASGEAASQAAALMAAFDASPLAGRLAALDVLGREVPVLMAEGTARWRGVIDLIYREPSGAVVVADYKTDASSDGASARHGPQLAVYMTAVARAMPGALVRAELWMLRTGEIIPLPEI
jgi:ATP-dependent helicase/nuclease subunit A